MILLSKDAACPLTSIIWLWIDLVKLKKTLAPWKESYGKPRQRVKMQRHHFVNKGPCSQSCGFSSGHVLMWELDHKEGWVPKNWCFRIVGLEKILESPLDNKQIKPVNPKRNQLRIFIGRNDAEAEPPILWPLDVNSRLTRKDLATGNDWGQEEKQTTEEKMIGWHHQLSEHVFERTQGNSEGQGSLACCGPWGPRESDMS